MLKNFDKVWTSADPHFAHSNIIKYCDRPFKTAHGMDKTMIDNWNAIVGPDDLSYILGDFSMSAHKDFLADYVKKLNGNKILVLGNHDRLRPFEYLDIGFLSVHTSLVLENENVFMIHDPAAMRLAMEAGFTCLHGHVHNVYKKSNPGTLNVGVDVHDYKPILLSEAIKQANEIAV